MHSLSIVAFGGCKYVIFGIIKKLLKFGALVSVEDLYRF